MAGFFGTKAPVTSDIALVLEIAIIIILFVSRFRFARGKRYVTHGYTMAFAVGLHFVTILLVMIPAFINVFLPNLGGFSTFWIIIVLIHIPAGVIAWLIALFLVVTWRFHSEKEMKCHRRRRLMRPLFWLWTFALVLGIVLYSAYFLV